MSHSIVVKSFAELAELIELDDLPAESITEAGESSTGSESLVDTVVDLGALLAELHAASATLTSFAHQDEEAREVALRDLEQYEEFVAQEREGEEAGYRAAVELLKRQPQIDAICALVDAFATGALRAVLESGRRVPGDVMLATRYDGLRARLAQPPLTAVDLRLDIVASTAVDLLLRHLRGADAPMRVPAPAATLVARGSTDRPAVRQVPGR